MHELVDIISEILIMIQRESQKTLSRQVGHVESCQRHLSFKILQMLASRQFIDIRGSVKCCSWNASNSTVDLWPRGL